MPALDHAPRLGIVSVDRGIDDTRAWLRDLADALGWDDPQQTWNALRALLHTVRDELSIADAALLAQDLPVLLRGVLYEGWSPRARTPDTPFHARLAASFPLDLAEVDAPTLCAAFLHVVGHHLPADRCAHLYRALPREVSALWRGATRFLV